MNPYLLHHFLERQAELRPDAEFLVTHDPGGAHLSFGAVDRAANQFARLFARLGVTKGDRVAVLAHNGAEYVTAYFGALKAGAAVVPMNTGFDVASLARCIRDSGARVLFVGPRLERLLVGAGDALEGVTIVTPSSEVLARECLGARVVSSLEANGEVERPLDVRRIDRDLASIVYTSGSTGKPRGAALSHLALVSNARSIAEYLALSETDRVLCVLPFHYVYGKSLLTMSLVAGSAVVVENRFQYVNVALDTLERERCTGLAGVPSTFAILLDRSNLRERKLESLRWVTQAGGAMPPALTRRLVEALPRCRVHVMYGATEAAARLSHLSPEELPEAVGSIGRAIPNVELTVRRPDGSEAEVDEPGELFARGSNLMTGYWNMPEETAAVLGPHGYATGDLAKRDAAGLLWIVGRKTEMLKVGGHRVSAREVEDAIAEHPLVSEVAVVGVRDDLLGEKLKAFVVVRPGETIDGPTLGRFLKGKLPAYKIPDAFECRDELPKNAAGKVMKQALVDA